MARTTTYRLRRAASLVFGGIGLVPATLSITGATDVPTAALFMFLGPALALSPVKWLGSANDPPSHLARSVRVLRIVQITCLAVGFGLGALEVLSTHNVVVEKAAALLFMASLLLTLVFSATTWPAPGPELQS